MNVLTQSSAVGRGGTDQAKKFTTRKGNAESLILIHVFKRWKVEFSSSDEADAFVLAKISRWPGDVKGLTREQIKIIKAIKKVAA